MKRRSDKKGSQSGPKDRSLEAYKIWFMEITKRLTKEGTEIKLTRRMDCKLERLLEGKIQ